MRLRRERSSRTSNIPSNSEKVILADCGFDQRKTSCFPCIRIDRLPRLTHFAIFWLLMVDNKAATALIF